MAQANNYTQVFEIEEPETGKIYKVEGVEGTTREEAIQYLSSLPDEEIAKREIIRPNAMLGANTPQQGVATRELKDFPEGKNFLQDQFYNRKQFGEVQEEFNKRYGALGVKLPENMAGVWAENQALFDTPQGRQYLQNNDPIAPVQVASGVEDIEAPDSWFEEFGTSAKKAVYDTANAYRGVAAIGADLLGAEETAKHWLDDYLEQDAANQLNMPTSTGGAKDISSLGEAGMYSANVLGALVPDIMASLGIGVVGGVIGKHAVKQVADTIVERELAAGATEEAAKLAAAKVIEKATVRSGIAATTGQSMAQESGSTVGQTYGKTGEVRSGRSLLAGITSGTLEALFPARILSRIGGKAGAEALTDSLVKKIGKDAAEGILIEGIPEALQDIITQLPAGQPIDWDQVVESFIRGGVGGATVNTGVGVIDRTLQAQSAPKIAPEVPSGVPEGQTPISVPTTPGRRTAAFKREIAQTVSEVDARVKHLSGGWQNAPKIETHQNFNQLKNAPNNAVGVYADGKLLVNTETIIKHAKATGRTVDQVVSSLTYHEGLGHHGLALEFGTALDDKLATMLASSPTYKARVDAWLKKNPDAYEGDPNRDLRAFEELLAERSENGQLPTSVVSQLKNTVKDFGRRMGLDLEYSTREVETILAMAHSAVVNGKGRDVRSNGFNFLAPQKFMYAGQKAQTANLSRLEFAKHLERTGVNTEEIRRKLGWFKADDDKWRFEIKDRDSLPHILNEDDIRDLIDELDDWGETNPDNIREWQYSTGLEFLTRSHPETTSLYLEQVLDHAELFAAYPELKNLLVFRKHAEDSDPTVKENQGSYSPAMNAIYINSSLPEYIAHNVLLHEVQHAVQEIEDFARGGSPKSALKKVDSANLIKGARQYIKWLGTPDGRAYIVEASAPGGRFPIGTTSDKVKSVIKTLIEAEQYNALRDFFTTDKGAAFEAYQHLLGEVEARDVQNRQDFSDEELQQFAPYETEAGIDPDSYIIDVDIPTQRYMMLSKPENVKFTPEEIAEMPAEDLFEAENALTVLRRMTEGYSPVVMTMDDLQEEAQLRGFSASELLRQKGVDPGELVKRIFMYDIAAEKLQDRITELYHKMQEGQANPRDYAAHAKALHTMAEVTQKIFDTQGELGRSLNAMKYVNFTRRRVGATMEMLAQFQPGTVAGHLNDPEEYMKFAMSIQQQIEESKQKMKENGGRWAANVVNVPRAIMSTLDMSAPLRQGLFLIHKGAWWKSFVNMFRYATSEQAYQDLMEGITSRNSYPTMMAANLALSDMDGKLTKREEDFQTDLLKHVPILKHLVRSSERAYSGFLNRLRADVFDELLAKLGDNYTAQDIKDLGAFVNSASGRGNLHKSVAGGAPVWNGVFFSPRLIASRLDMSTRLLRPSTYTKMNKVARNEYIKSLLAVGVGVSLVLTMFALAGADVEKDPRSSDFGKIKVGNTRYDIMGGEGQYITLAARLIKGAEKTADGEIRPYGTDVGQKTEWDAAMKFATNKFSPIASFVTDYLRRQDAIGQKFEADRAVVQRMVPMFAMDLYENMRDEGYLKGTAMTAPAIFGIGVQNYKSYSQDPTREIEAPTTFKMKTAKDGEYNNATVEDGVVKLDDKAQKEWNRRLNTYIREWMKDEMAAPEWKTLTKEERKAVIKAVRDDARDETKADMLELLQIEEVE